MNGASIEFSTEPTGSEAPVQVAERPANVPEKFWDAATGTVKTDDLLKSYGALESKLGAPKDAPVETPTETPTETPEEKPEGEPEKDAGERAVEEAGLDMEALGEHFLEHGKLDDDAYEKLGKLGITKEDADGYAAYKLSQADQLRTEMFAPFGGEEGIEKMQSWAAQNWTEAQAKAFNDAAESKDRGRIELALKSLKSDYDKANGVRPKLLTGKGGATPTGDQFASTEQFLAAQRDPRYKTDPAYRQSVIDKLARSPNV